MSRQVVMLCGGVGGARLAHGMYHALSQDELTLIVNTGDDFEHWGLQICPDLDTVMYSLADLAPVERGWGLETESFEALDMVKRYGGEDWFALGDRDLATHLMRSQRLREGHSLTSVTQGLASSRGVHCYRLPGPPQLPTVVRKTSGETDRSRYLLGIRCQCVRPSSGGPRRR